MPMQAADLGGWYNESNVGISGIHTHSGPGGYLQYVLYDITSLGFVEQSWEAVVDGIATVSAAHLLIVHGKGSRQCEHCCDAVTCSSPAGNDPSAGVGGKSRHRTAASYIPEDALCSADLTS